MDAVETVDQLRTANATGLGGADGTKPEPQRLRRSLERRAFPIIYPPDDPAPDPAEGGDA